MSLLFSRSLFLFITIFLSSEQVLSMCQLHSNPFLISDSTQSIVYSELDLLRLDINRILRANNPNDPVMISDRIATLFVNRIERFEREELVSFTTFTK